MSYQVGFIGCGNMGGALARAVAAAGANGLAVCDRDPQKATVLGGACGAKVCSAAEIATECAFIFLGVKPQVYPEAIAEIAPAQGFRLRQSRRWWAFPVRSSVLCPTRPARSARG